MPGQQEAAQKMHKLPEGVLDRLVRDFPKDKELHETFTAMKDVTVLPPGDYSNLKLQHVYFDSPGVLIDVIVTGYAIFHFKGTGMKLAGKSSINQGISLDYPQWTFKDQACLHQMDHMNGAFVASNIRESVVSFVGSSVTIRPLAATNVVVAAPQQ